MGLAIGMDLRLRGWLTSFRLDLVLVDQPIDQPTDGQSRVKSRVVVKMMKPKVNLNRNTIETSPRQGKSCEWLRLLSPNAYTFFFIRTKFIRMLGFNSLKI